MRVVQTLLFVGGINTLLQTLFGTRLPTVIGGSYAFIVPIISIIQDSSFRDIPDGHEVLNFAKQWPAFLRLLTSRLMQRFLQTIRAIQGALIVASSIQIILGYSQLWGICSRFTTSNSLTPCQCTSSTLA